MMVQRIYIDTSVIGGYFDEEFEFYTKLFFEKVEQGKFKVILVRHIDDRTQWSARRGA
jgi:hypothetical protein